MSMSELIRSQIAAAAETERNATVEYFEIRTDTTNVSNPPTDAELDSVFGAASALPDGFIGILDDAGGAVDVWLCIVMTNSWWYEKLTKAV